MQLIQAKITGKPRTVKTKHGERSVVDARAANGESLTIWRPANDPAMMRLANGERVQLTIDTNGRVSLVETAFDRAESQRAEISPTVEPAPRPMGFNVALPMEGERKLRQQLAAAAPSQIDGRIAELGRVYAQCLMVANGSELAAIEIFRAAIG